MPRRRPPGAQARHFLATSPPPRKIAEAIIVRFVAEVLARETRLRERHVFIVARALVTRRLRQLIGGIDREWGPDQKDSNAASVTMADEAAAP